jgi:hypothetical protein
MIIPYAAGGGVDIIGRSVAAAMSEHLGQGVVVVNRDGAGGTLGFNALASAAADGYTLGTGPTTPISSPYLIKGVRYRVESFEYICQVFENVGGRSGFQIQVRARFIDRCGRESRNTQLRACRGRQHPAPLGRKSG